MTSTPHRKLARRIRGAARAVLAAPPPSAPMALRLAAVVSHDVDGTMTVLLDGGNVAGVRRVGGGWLPPPGGGVWLVGVRPNLWALASTDDRVGFSHTVLRSSTQSFPTGTGSPITVSWQTLDPNPTGTDPFGAWVSGSPTNVVVPAKGRYMLVGRAQVQANSVGQRSLWITAGGTEVGRITVPASSAGDTRLPVVVPARSFAKGTVLQMLLNQDSSVTLTLNLAEMTLVYLGPG